MRWLPGARMGVSAARAQGQAQRVTTAMSSARARLQIDISQNSDTPVPKRGKNEKTNCTLKKKKSAHPKNTVLDLDLVHVAVQVL